MESVNVDELLQQLTLPEKVALLAGDDFWHTVAIPRLKIPRIRFSDGPNGVRGIKCFDSTPAACFPCATAMAATWDEELQFLVGQAMGLDCRAKGVHLLLGPTMNIHRSPLGGRGFESFSEDPYLSGRMAAQYIRGLQGQGVAATVKHFVCNDQEHKRYATNVMVSERALREIYLRPFEIVIREAAPWALMAAYNSVNGHACTENDYLIRRILRSEWGYQGLIMSDWLGVYGTAESIRTGVNLEMPGPTLLRGQAALRALGAGRISEVDINANVKKVLELLKRAIDSGIPFDAEQKVVDTPEMRSLLRRSAAESIVMLKNDKSLLPLQRDKVRKIAVIGPNARTCIISGGGSAALRPTHSVSVLDAIKAKVGKNAEVGFAVGCEAGKLTPMLEDFLHPAHMNSQHGMFMEFFNDDPWETSHKEIKAVHSVICEETKCILIDNLPETVNRRCWVRLSAVFVPDQSGIWEFGLVVAAGQGDLYIDGRKIIDNTMNQKAGEEFAMAGTLEELGSLEVTAGNAYSLEIRFTNERPVPNTTVPMGRGAIRLGGGYRASDQENIEVAATLAGESDVVVLVVGLNGDWEAEGFDRADMKLPLATDQLITQVLRANSDTVVVIQSGTPVEMPWVSDAATVLQAWYGGNEFGNGIVDVIFGSTNPCGRLSLSYPFKLEHNPTYYNWGDESGESRYGEGIFVGYRHYEAVDRPVMFPFGFGLSYNQSVISQLQLQTISAGSGRETVAKLTFVLENITSFVGKEVVQVYVGSKQPRVRRPLKELKAFRKFDIGSHEKKVCAMTLSLEAFAYFDSTRYSWLAEKGQYTVYVALSSSDIKVKEVVHLETDVTWV